jgi:DNA-binding transcriptional ArsR family regulator
MHALDILGDPVRRRILELLASDDGRERSSGELAAAIAREFGISHPAVSQHLKVLRDNGFASVRAEGTRRLYAVEPGPLEELDAWVSQFRAFWSHRLDALGTELRRGRRAAPVPAPPADPADPADPPANSPANPPAHHAAHPTIGRTADPTGRPVADKEKP